MLGLAAACLPVSALADDARDARRASLRPLREHAAAASPRRPPCGRRGGGPACEWVRRHQVRRFCRERRLASHDGAAAHAAVRGPGPRPGGRASGPRAWRRRPPGGALAPRPNVILVVTDDQRADSLHAMPIMMDRLADEGIRFDNGFVPTPQCASSRASILTGRYTHGTNVVFNNGVDFDPSSTLATRLQEVGYRTALIGKYINGNILIAPEVPPGWDRWQTFLVEAYFDYRLNEDGQIVAYGSDPADYSTDVLAGKALAFIEESADEPFFMIYAPFGPHLGAEPAPRHVGAFAGMPPWRPPSFLEEDISDKPRWVHWVQRLRLQNGPEALPAYIAQRDRVHEAELETLLSIDEAIGAILDALERAQLDRDTLIVFTSDNGLLWGEHWLGNKYSAYEESIRVPFVLRYPRLLRSGRVDERLVLNIDLAPTILELAGAPVPEEVDGKSLVGALCGLDEPWREDFLLEQFVPRGLDSMPAYRGLRTGRYKYVRYVRGGEELYDLERDPWELDNLMVVEGDDPATRERADALWERIWQLNGPPLP